MFSRYPVMKERLVFLVPGFFGFTAAGAVSYFEDVERTIMLAVARRGIKARIVRCATQPTSSIRRRADALRRQVLEAGGLRARELHFIGHSTGGLDLRMLLTPGVRLAKGESEERIAAMTKSAITVATPHHGTPLANYFVTVQGRTLLLLLSALAISGPGRRAIVAGANAIGLGVQLGDWLGLPEGPLFRISEALLRKLRYSRRDPVWRYLADIERDQGAILQLTPEGIDLFDAAVADRDGIDYGCVVAGVPEPREEFSIGALMDPQYLAMRALFRFLHVMASRSHAGYPYPPITRAKTALLSKRLGFKVTSGTSDGVVPTLSQLHGRLLHVARADHLDVVGHYTLAGGSTGNWLPSGAGFTRKDFDALWESVAAKIAAA